MQEIEVGVPLVFLAKVSFSKKQAARALRGPAREKKKIKEIKRKRCLITDEKLPLGFHYVKHHQRPLFKSNAKEEKKKGKHNDRIKPLL